jgi:hypothetical protein
MNQLTEQFFRADFPGWRPRQDFNTVWENFWINRDIPILELDLGINTGPSCEWIKQNQSRFEQVWNQKQYDQHCQQLGHSWFKQPHSEGRWDLRVSGQYPKLKKLLDHEPWQELDQQQQITHQDAVPDLKHQLQQQGAAIHGMKIARLDPGGYLEPHKDSLMSTDTMTHLWIPLNSTAANLKIWPWGMLEHRVGSVYLLNNQSFVHAITNRDTKSRYVVTARLDPEKTNPELVAKIRVALKQQWFS